MRKPSAKCSCFSESILLTARNSGLPVRCSRRASSKSGPASSLRPSTTTMMAAASSNANRACRKISEGIKSSSSGTIPPVSTSRKKFPSHSASEYSRSRVIPGSSPTIARRRPVMRLNNVDLPTFGRPTMHSTGKPAETVSATAEPGSAVFTAVSDFVFFFFNVRSRGQQGARLARTVQ